jgi:hypothetical protein
MLIEKYNSDVLEILLKIFQNIDEFIANENEENISKIYEELVKFHYDALVHEDALEEPIKTQVLFLIVDFIDKYEDNYKEYNLNLGRIQVKLFCKASKNIKISEESKNEKECDEYKNSFN